MTPSSSDADTQTPITSNSRLSFERLRERTDELELIISGLTTVALFALPGWMLERYALLYPKLPMPAIAAAELSIAMLVGLCYVLGALFATHVGVRAYWVGLIGLKTVFPNGIRWEVARSYGPISRADLKQRLPSIDAAIDAADRAASTLFAIISLGALSSLWGALFIALLFLSASLVGLAIGATNAVIVTTLLGFSLLIVGSSVLIWLLDAVLAARYPRLAHSRPFANIVMLLRGLLRLIFPERLIAPVQLTLQTNTRPRLFGLLFGVAMLAIPMIGIQQSRAYFNFDAFGNQTYIDDQDLTTSGYHVRSRYYESHLQPRDLRRMGPVIPDPVTSMSWMPLFLPYFPVLDDPVLRQLCGERTEGAAAECVRKLWQVELNAKPVALDSFMLAQRNDLGFRGLQGWLDLSGQKPGPQQLRVVWNPSGSEERRPDDYLPARIEYHIPFLLAPEWGNDAPQSGD